MKFIAKKAPKTFQFNAGYLRLRLEKTARQIAGNTPYHQKIE